MLTAQKIDAFLEGPYLKLWKKLERDADRQLKVAKSQRSRIPANYQDDYKADAGLITRIRRTLADELKDIERGRAKPKRREPIRSMFQDYEMSIVWVEKLNAKWELVISANILGMVGSLAALSVAWIKNMPREMNACIVDFGALNKQLVVAGKNLGDAHAQRAVNVLISVLAAFLGPAAGLSKAVVSLGSMVASLSLDALLGVDNPNTAEGKAGEVSTAINGASGAYKRTAGTWSKFASSAATVITLKVDTSEVREAERQFADIQAKMKRTVDRYTRIHATLQKELPNLRKHQRTLDAISKAYGRIKGNVRRLDAEAVKIRRKIR